MTNGTEEDGKWNDNNNNRKKQMAYRSNRNANEKGKQYVFSCALSERLSSSTKSTSIAIYCAYSERYSLVSIDIIMLNAFNSWFGSPFLDKFLTFIVPLHAEC